MKKLTPVSKRPIDVSTRHASISVSRRQYLAGVEKGRAEAKRNKFLLITNEGTEDYRDYDGPVPEPEKPLPLRPRKETKPATTRFVKLKSGTVINMAYVTKIAVDVPNGVPGMNGVTTSGGVIWMSDGSWINVGNKEAEVLLNLLKDEIKELYETVVAV